MINYISNRVLNYLIKNGVISNNEYELAHYKYGIEITISSSLNILLISLLGLLLSKIKLSFFFLFLFISIRQLTGGFHAKTYFKCNLTMCTSFIICVFATTILTNHVTFLCFVGHIIISSTIILLFCPISNENKPIKPESRNKFKIASFLITNFFSILGYFIYKMNMEIGLFIIMTIIIINGLIIISKFTERRIGHETEC